MLSAIKRAQQRNGHNQLLSDLPMRKENRLNAIALLGGHVGKAADDLVSGEVKSSDGNTFVSGTGRIRERQKYSTSETDPESNCTERKT